MKCRRPRSFVADFETTVFDGQTSTEVWAAALVELHSDDVSVYHSIDEFFDAVFLLRSNLKIYFHNLKFDGAFILSYLINVLHLKQAFSFAPDSELPASQINPINMQDRSFNYVISSQGQWYTITIKIGNYIIEIRDSLKLLPFPVRDIGKAFGTKHKKLEMEYEGKRYAGCEIKPKEEEYIKNDVLVVKEALEIMFSQGHENLTIGACCLKEFKRAFSSTDWRHFFPNLLEIPLDPEQFGSANADEYIRKSYKGGWCYLVPEKAGKIYASNVKGKPIGITADVNSLYPSVMHSESGNYYPYGRPTFWQGNYIPTNIQNNSYYYFVRVRTRFYIKPNMLPCIQIKNSLFYRATQWLTTSDVYDYSEGKYCPYYYDTDGNIKPAIVELTLTQTDLALIQEHYKLIDFEILDGCYFKTDIGIFDYYINKYKKIKTTSKGAMRTLAKLFLNNLYGKFATSPISSFKYAKADEQGVIKYYTINAYDKEPVFIAIGSAVTSYARDFTIRTAQKNYYGADKRGFIYADTDSIHCDLSAEELVGVPVHSSDFCKWKLEASWDTAIFTRQKTYIEHVTEEELEPIDEPYYNIKCAGMPEKCKELFAHSMEKLDKKLFKEKYPEQWKKYNKKEREFVTTPRDLSDFNIGLCVPSKLTPKTILGGVILQDTTYEMRPF